MTVLELAGGIILGLAGYRIVDTLIDVPFALMTVHNERKKEARFKFMIDETMGQLVNHLKSDEYKAHVKGSKNARNSSKTTKSTRTRASNPQRKAASSTRNSAKKVSTTKKGV